MRGQREIHSYASSNNQGYYSPQNAKAQKHTGFFEKRIDSKIGRTLSSQDQDIKKPPSREFRKDNQDGRYSPTSLSSQINQMTNKYFKSVRPGSRNNNEDDYKNKGIGLTLKVGRPLSNDKDKQFEQKPTLTGSQSHGHLVKSMQRLPQKSQTPTGSVQIKIPQYGKRAQISQYQKLHQKLNTLENKIAAMKINLEKKKAQKQIALSRDRKQKRTKHYQKQQHKQVSNHKVIDRPSKTNNDKIKSQSGLKGIVTQVPRQNKQLHSFDHNPYSPRHNMYYVSEIVKAYKEQKSLARQHLLTSMQLLKIMESVKKNSYTETSVKPLNLQQKSIYKGKKTVVFDLDETLIHCNQSTNLPYDVVLPIKFPSGQVVDAGINIRPHAIQMLKSLSTNFQVIVFTASHSCYGNVVIDHLDPQKKYIQHRLFRQNCFLTPQGMYVKDIRVINRKQTDMVLIDNAAYSYAFQLDNGIPIIPYYEGKNDFQLKALQSYIQRLIWVPDVRDVNKKIFKLHQYRNYEDPQKLVKQLYRQWML